MRLLPILFFSLGILVSCKNNPAGQAQKSAEMDDLPKDFLEFYQQFHTDSVYQVTHIEWPLKGEKMVMVDSTSKKVLTEWQPETWVMFHQPDLNDVGLKRSYETVGDALITERLQYPMVNFGLERQFYKDEQNNWRLIFYSEMQELK